MSITDELREYIKQTNWAMTSKAKWFAIADRIDIEHEAQLKDAFETRSSDENQENDGWVRGPLDADGVMWHEGDISDGWGEIELIIRDCDGHWYIKGHDMSAPWVRADSKRHHHKPTIEDVLREFGERYCDTVAGCAEESELFAEYAAKLQLRGDVE